MTINHLRTEKKSETTSKARVYANKQYEFYKKENVQ